MLGVKEIVQNVDMQCQALCQPVWLQRKKKFPFLIDNIVSNTAFNNARRSKRRPRSKLQRQLCLATLEEEISQCTEAADLLDKIKRNSSKMNQRPLAAAWNVLLKKNILRNGEAAKLRSTNNELKGLLLSLTMPLVSSLEPSQISMISRAMVATETGTSKDIMTISSEIQTRLINFEPKELCMVLWALSTHPGMTNNERHYLFGSLASLVDKGMGLDLFSSRDLSILVWSMAHVSYSNKSLVKAAEIESAKKIQHFNPDDTSRIMHGFAGLKHNPTTFLPLLIEKYEDHLDAFGPADLTLLYVSLGKLVVEPSLNFTRAMNRRAKELLPRDVKSRAGEKAEFDLHLNAQILWSFARLGLKRTAFSSQGIKYASHHISDHHIEDLTAVLWACCRLQIDLSDSCMCDVATSLAHRSQESASTSIVQPLRYLLILYTRLGEDKSCLDELKPVRHESSVVLQRIAPKLQEIPAWDVCTLAISLSTTGIILDAKTSLIFQRAIEISIESVPASLLPKLAFAIAKMKWSNVEMLNALASSTVKRSGLIKPEVRLPYIEIKSHAYVWSN